MVATCKFVSAANPAALADYYMRQTEDVQDRDRDRDYMRMPIPKQDGTIPLLRQDIAHETMLRMGFDGQPTREHVYEIVAGRKADGEPTGKRPRKDYVFANGKQCKSKHFMDVTLSTDISVGIALANAETPAGRSLILSAVHGAADDAMAAFERRLGTVIKPDGEHQGRLVWMRFTHHATRPAQDGSVAPDLHMHHVVPNIVLLNDGRVGAINMRLMHGFVHDLGATFHNSLAERAQAVGIAVARHPKTRGVMFADVPQRVREHFAKRGKEMRAKAQEWAGDRELTSRMVQTANKRTQSKQTDGKATRIGWRADMLNLGFAPRDVAQPGLVETQPKPAMTLTERAHRLRNAMVQTWQVARHQVEQATLHGTLKPSLTRAIALTRQMVPTLTRRAERLLEAMTYTPGAANMKQMRKTHERQVAAAAWVADAAKMVGQRIRATGAAHTMVKIPTMDVPKFREPDINERMVRIMARKVHAQEITMSEAVDRFIKREEFSNKPIGHNPVHDTYIYAPGTPGPQNRYGREEKWEKRIGEAVLKLEAGKDIWADTVKPAVHEQRQALRMGR